MRRRGYGLHGTWLPRPLNPASPAAAVQTAAVSICACSSGASFRPTTATVGPVTSALAIDAAGRGNLIGALASHVVPTPQRLLHGLRSTHEPTYPLLFSSRRRA